MMLSLYITLGVVGYFAIACLIGRVLGAVLGADTKMNHAPYPPDDEEVEL